MEVSSNKSYLCPNCQRDFGDEVVRSVWSNIFEENICEYCDLEIGLEFDPAFGDTYTRMAVQNSGLDILEVKKKYLQQIIEKVEEQLAGNLDKKMRKHRLRNLNACNNQLHAITNYQQAMINGDDKKVVSAKNDLEKAMASIAFGMDLIRGYSINYLTD